MEHAQQIKTYDIALEVLGLTMLSLFVGLVSRGLVQIPRQELQQHQLNRCPGKHYMSLTMKVILSVPVLYCIY